MGVKVEDLKNKPQGAVLHCPNCGSDFSADYGDYSFWMDPNEVFTCEECEEELVSQRRQRRTQSSILTRTDSMREIKGTELPEGALAQISERQRSYLDEFSFYENETNSEHIDAWYAGELLAVWNGNAWIDPKQKKRQ